MTLVAKVPDIVASREPGCMACAVDAMEWGWGENAGCISKIITFIIVFFVTVIAIFSLIGIPFIFCTLYEYGSRNTAEAVDKVVRSRITTLTEANNEKQETIVAKNTRIAELKQVRDRRASEAKDLKKAIRALKKQVDALGQQLKEAQDAPKGGTLKSADVRPYTIKIKELTEQVEQLTRENAGLTAQIMEKEGQKSLTQHGIAIATALMHLTSCASKETGQEEAIESAMSALASSFSDHEKSISNAWNLLHQARSSSDPDSLKKAIHTAILILQGKHKELESDGMTADDSDSEDESPDPARDHKTHASSDPGHTLHVPDHKENKEPAKLQPRAPAKAPSSLKL